jgi:hypothetical protein
MASNNPIPPTWDSLIARFRFTPEDVKDSRIKRLVFQKLAWDAEIIRLREAFNVKVHAAEEQVEKTATRLGFTPADVQKLPQVRHGLQSLTDSLLYLANLQSAVKSRKPVAGLATKPTQKESK